MVMTGAMIGVFVSVIWTKGFVVPNVRHEEQLHCIVNGLSQDMVIGHQIRSNLFESVQFEIERKIDDAIVTLGLLDKHSALDAVNQLMLSKAITYRQYYPPITEYRDVRRSAEELEMLHDVINLSAKAP